MIFQFLNSNMYFMIIYDMYYFNVFEVSHLEKIFYLFIDFIYDYHFIIFSLMTKLIDFNMNFYSFLFFYLISCFIIY